MKASKLKIWFLGIRPKTLSASIVPVFMGLALAFYDKNYLLHIPFAILTFLSAVLIQIGTNLSNDYFDFIKGADNPKRVGPIRIMQSGLVTKKEMLFAVFIVFSLSALCGIFLILRGGIPILIIGILSILFGFLYTAGPHPLGYLGIGEFFVLIFFGMVALTGTYYIQTLVFKPILLIFGLIPGFFAVAILSANNIRDIETDREAGKKTLAVRFGRKFAKVEYIFSMLFPYILLVMIVLILKDHYLSLLSIITVFMSVKPLKIILMLEKHKPVTLILVLEKTSQIMLVFSIIFCITWNITI